MEIILIFPKKVSFFIIKLIDKIMRGLAIIIKEIEESITKDLSRCGLLFRIFSRVKSKHSIESKISLKKDKYRSNNEKMQDLLGLRITLYFSDDVNMLYSFLHSKREFVSESRDIIEVDKFCPQRLNLIMRIPNNRKRDFLEIVSDLNSHDLIDDTYEIQIRTVLSEGWHEVEHDLRYKCQNDWNEFPVFSRTLNGIYATLETGEWSMLSLFYQLAHENYKTGKWGAMMRNKMRIRYVNDSLSDDVILFLNENKNVAKKILRASREKILHMMLNKNFRIPITYDTIIHLINRHEVNCKELELLEDSILKEYLDDFFLDNCV